MENFEKTLSRENTKDEHLHFFLDKCQYIKNGAKNEKLYYRCKVRECSARETLFDGIFQSRNQHCAHENHEEDFKFEKFKIKLRTTVQATTESIEEVFSRELKRLVST